MNFHRGYKLSLAAITVGLLSGCASTTGMGESSYDSSTVSPRSVTTPKYSTAKGIVFPALNSPSIHDALVEAKSFASSTSRRFSYKFKETSIGRVGPFYFPGGNIFALKGAIEKKGIFADVVGASSLAMYRTKRATKALPHFNKKNTSTLTRGLKRINGVSGVSLSSGASSVSYTYTLAAKAKAEKLISSFSRTYKTHRATKNLPTLNKKDTARLKRGLSSISGVTSVKISGGNTPVVSYTYTTLAKDKADKYLHSFRRSLGATVGVKANDGMTIKDIVQRLYPYETISHFEDERYVVNSGGVLINDMRELNHVLNRRGKSIKHIKVYDEAGKKVSSFVVSEFKPLILDHPYTIKTALKELGDLKGVRYETLVDGNIPVNKSVRINKLEDLNRYLKETTGQTLKARKTKQGTVIIKAGN